MPLVTPRRPGRGRVVLVAAVAVLVSCTASSPDPVRAPVPPAVVASLGGIDLDAATIPELQAHLDAGDFSAVELTGAYLARIEELDDELGAVLHVNPNAEAEADTSDGVRRRTGARSPLEGIPVLLKDTVGTADMPTTAGSRALLGSRPGDAPITRRLREAGAIVLGKANLSEWANFRGDDATSGWSAVGGQTNNPHVLDRNPCGSSSGSAAAVAASLAQVAIGTETDGSIVCPSGTTGVVGLKPTLGLVSRSGIVPISAEQDTPGPMARHVVDAALLLQVISGADPADPATLEAPGDVLGGLGLDDGALDADALDGARIGVLRLSREESATVDDDTEAVFAAAVDAIESAGAAPVPVQLADQEEIFERGFEPLLAEFHRDLDAYLAATPGDHPADLAGVIAFNEQDSTELDLFDQEIFEQAEDAAVPAEDPAVRDVREDIRRLARASIDDSLAQGAGADDDLDAIVALTNTPGWITRYEHEDGMGDEFGYGSSTPAAVAGYPNVSVPAGYSGPEGALPIGISFIGPRWGDAAVLHLAFAFESEVQARRAPGFLRTVGN